ncbi:metallophosphoesterase family protein [Salipiger mucosus]|nr:metallophosphoesterase [Salipiger mucosus]
MWKLLLHTGYGRAISGGFRSHFYKEIGCLPGSVICGSLIKARQHEEQETRLLVYGDPHGNYAPLIDACSAKRPDAMLIAGDMTAPKDEPERIRPIRSELAELLEEDIEIIWTHGNHDTDSPEIHDATFESFPEGHLHGGVRTLKSSGLRVAALGGVFRGQIWYPEMHYEDPARYQCPETFLQEKDCAWRGGLPLRHRSSIFPSDAERIKQIGADILLTHEAPSAVSPHGFLALDQLADDMGAKVIFHGHHHISYADELMNGIQVRGLGLAEPVRVYV